MTGKLPGANMELRPLPKWRPALSGEQIKTGRQRNTPQSLEMTIGSGILPEPYELIFSLIVPLVNKGPIKLGL
ncbi:hypothetical protein ACOMHN_025254 [Nucella lapillus]